MAANAVDLPLPQVVDHSPFVAIVPKVLSGLNVSDAGS
jgi:hypothetical protein